MIKIRLIRSLIILILGFGPGLPAVVAGKIASDHHCELDARGAHACMIDGTDRGAVLLTTAGYSFLMAMLTVPTGVVALSAGLWATLNPKRIFKYRP